MRGRSRNIAAILFLDHVFHSARAGRLIMSSIDARRSVLRERLIFLRSSSSLCVPSARSAIFAVFSRRRIGVGASRVYRSSSTIPAFSPSVFRISLVVVVAYRRFRARARVRSTADGIVTAISWSRRDVGAEEKTSIGVLYTRFLTIAENRGMRISRGKNLWKIPIYRKGGEIDNTRACV